MTRIVLFLSAVLAAAPATAQTRERGPAERVAGSTSAEDSTVLVPQTIITGDEASAALFSILDTWEELARYNGSRAGAVRTATTRRRLEQLTAADFETWGATGGNQLLHLKNSVDALATLVRSRYQPSDSSHPVSPPPTSISSPGFPSADYPDVELPLRPDCKRPNGERTPDDEMFAYLDAILAAEAVKDVACACDPFCPVCAIAIGVFGVVNEIWQDLLMCEGMVDSAELSASYDRLEHIHGDLEDQGAQMEAGFQEILDALACAPLSPLVRHHGCDGSDNDCDETIDGCSEDTAAPDLFIDPSVERGCYKDAATAAATVRRAAHILDDCQQATLGGDVSLSGSQCSVNATVTGQDACGNQSIARTELVIDGSAPSVTIPPTTSNQCYTTVAAGEQAVLQAAQVSDNCTPGAELVKRAHSSVTECSLRVLVTTEDRCGQEGTGAATVRVDAALPTVLIARELVAPRDRACYSTADAAQVDVFAATHFSDNCTAREALVTGVSSSGGLCGLTVTSSARDECGNQNTDSVVTRVDATTPVVSCSVTLGELAPPDNKLMDVGFSYSVSDNCDSSPKVEILVTSDESTSNNPVGGGPDQAPDGTLLQDLAEPVTGILLRAQRSTDGDGRVYRIRVVGTDSCGNVGHSDCFVSVRRNPGKAPIDSGQFYDATTFN